MTVTVPMGVKIGGLAVVSGEVLNEQINTSSV